MVSGYLRKRSLELDDRPDWRLETAKLLESKDAGPQQKLMARALREAVERERPHLTKSDY